MSSMFYIYIYNIYIIYIYCFCTTGSGIALVKLLHCIFVILAILFFFLFFFWAGTRVLLCAMLSPRFVSVARPNDLVRGSVAIVTVGLTGGPRIPAAGRRSDRPYSKGIKGLYY
jgi:hypothetical protein